jgi:UDP-N-acetyl-D-glucosamine dehydrogenase
VKSVVDPKFNIAIIGLGYVGLPIARLFLEKGHTVYGIDVDTKKIHNLLNRHSYLSDFTAKDLKRMFANGTFHVSDSFSSVSHANAVILCVPTPLDQSTMPDLTYVMEAMKNTLPYLKKGHLVVLESSTYPGTTEEVLQPMMESTGLAIGKDVFLAYSPERIDPGAQRIPLNEIPKVLGGVSQECTAYAKKVYESIFHQIVVVSSPRVAEFTKILENCQRLVNISFINEMAMMCEKMDINLWEAIDAASTKPYGFTPYYPGPGIGGHCIPIDPLYLLWKAKQYGFDLQFIELAHRINEQMPDYVAHKVQKHLSAKKTLQDSSVFVIGVTYKKDVNDLRESAAIPIIEKLIDLGIKVSFHDPYIQEIQAGGQRIKGISLTKRYIQQHDCVLILTDHSQFPYESIVDHAELVIDTRNATKQVKGRDKIILI